MKPGKKLVPASFAEVIDSLLDSLLRYKVPSPEDTSSSAAQDGPSSMDTDLPSQVHPAGQVAAQNGSASTSAGPAASAQPAADPEAEAKAKEQQKVQMLSAFKFALCKCVPDAACS